MLNVTSFNKKQLESYDEFLFNAPSLTLVRASSVIVSNV